MFSLTNVGTTPSLRGEHIASEFRFIQSLTRKELRFGEVLPC